MNYDTKMGEKKDEYVNGAIRNSRLGKGRFDLVSPHALNRLAGVYERGGLSHGDWNWTNGVPFSRSIDSALRHINQYQRGMRDEDHLAQAAWNLFCVLHFEEVGRMELDDIPKHAPANPPN